MFDAYVGHVDVRGKRVLDIGAASGFLTFEAERRGADVVSFDIGHGGQQRLLPFQQKRYYRDHARWVAERTAHFEQWKNAYWLSHCLLNSRARAYYGDIHDLPPSLGRFEVVIVGSVLEHVNDQISALTSISRVTGETLVIATDLLDTEECVARFEPRASNPDQDYTWWTYSLGTYREVLGMLGFAIERVTSANYHYTLLDTTALRYTIVARRVAGA
jgi:SAM-dependent methyltransferase